MVKLKTMLAKIIPHISYFIINFAKHSILLKISNKTIVFINNKGIILLYYNRILEEIHASIN